MTKRRLLVAAMDLVIESRRFSAGEILGEIVDEQIQPAAGLDFGLIQPRLLRRQIVEGEPSDFKVGGARPSRSSPPPSQAKPSGV